ncbi:DUF6339 family protein [Mycolicibacterium sp. J2]|uniref:DUF6339 family protein n=1 Tax=Mycolicibacterium sp. J2 TaxID=2993511 RepID=UPI00224A6955|nr:DUF6339 family protein [Mycolicibacterium sp. J2]MCX2716034.1 DUF6339 family protein [Mycolicibacterium sp. J2]
MIVLPRIARHSATELLKNHLSNGIAEIASSMPDLTPTITYTPVGGQRIDNGQLEQLRTDIIELAHEHGMPNRIVEPPVFEGRAARLLHEALPMSANEASHEEVWSYLTCCWLLDVAVWRFGVNADERRFIGNVNRNTFRRLWWRAEILGPGIELTKLGEDELVNIMERPTISSDKRLARTVAIEFLDRVHEGAADSRMQLMREAMKRLLRLTPLVAFQALDDDQLRAMVENCFTAAAEGLAGSESGSTGRHRQAVSHDASSSSRGLPPVSPGVTVIDRMTITDEAIMSPASAEEVCPDFDVATSRALAIARGVGRVTNTSLRELVPITSGEAREVLQSLVRDGMLASRGVRRGTYYVLTEPASAVDRSWPPASTPQRSPETEQQEAVK